MKFTKEQIYNDLFIAFIKAKKHKENKEYVKIFKENLNENLWKLAEELYSHTYKHSEFIAFIANRPVPREIFASRFRDRIVHHLYYEYVHKYFEETFIEDSYSCIKGRGTSYGISRLHHHILSESQNYQKECYCLKIDIRAYFINIDRNILLDIVLKQIDKFEKKHKNDFLDYDFLRYLSKEIILLDPLENTIRRNPWMWETYNKAKSLYYAKLYCGLPIGNLTSQLFSNVYLNIFDQFVKRVLKAKHYGRYVDDGYIISCNKEYLRKCIPLIRDFLKNELHLTLHEGKTKIKDVKYGVEFLGAYIKPYRIYIANQALRRMHSSLLLIKSKLHFISCLISRTGLLRKYASFNIRKELFVKAVEIFSLKECQT